MATIVKYSEQNRPLNAYPRMIVSPERPSACCATGTMQIGDPEREGDRFLYYKRCSHCGYT